MSPDVSRLIENCTTVSDKIRALNAAGYKRADIARLLGKRYQHVRNVLEGDRFGGARVESEQAGLAETGRVFQPPPPSPAGAVEDRGGGVFRLTVAADGSAPLPESVREALGLKPGDGVIAKLEGETFVLLSARESLRRAQALVPQWNPGEALWSDELIEERKRDAEAEARR